MHFPFRIYFSADKKLYQSLNNLLGFYPGNLALYQLAFRHKSAAKEIKDGVKDSNERLEFLGDAVLSAIVGDYLFKTFPYKDEGFLTKMRAKIVSRHRLNQVGIKMGLETFIESNLDNSKSKSIHGDAFEALIGAIYMDKGYRKTQRFIYTRIINNLVDIQEMEELEIDFKSKLIEWAQKEKKEIRFELIEEVGSGHEKQYLVQVKIDKKPFGKNQHFSKKRAEQMAAEQTCLLLNI